MKRNVLAAVVAALACVSMAQAEVVIETVTVGRPGNTGELSGEGAGGYYGPDRICGRVNYVYNIGKYEVTNGQYTEFLNAVAATDTYGLYNTRMLSSSYGSKIRRTDSSGSYAYLVDADEGGSGWNREALVAVGLAIAAAVAIKIPALFGINAYA